MIETAPTLNLLDRPEIPEDVKMLLRVIPGQEQTEQGPPETAPDEGQTTEPYCPPWAAVTDPASDESFPVEGQRFIAPAVHEEPNPMLYPMCTVGIVYNSNGRRGEWRTRGTVSAVDGRSRCAVGSRQLEHGVPSRLLKRRPALRQLIRSDLSRLQHERKRHRVRLHHLQAVQPAGQGSGVDGGGVVRQRRRVLQQAVRHFRLPWHLR